MSSTTVLVPVNLEDNALYRAHLWLQKNRASSITIPLSGDVHQLFDEALIPLQRHIEKLYVDLPWPRQMQTIVIFNQIIEDGLGDIVTAAKAISLMLRILPKSTFFEWVTYIKTIGFSSPKKTYEPLSFLTYEERSRVEHTMFSDEMPKQKNVADFVVVCPIVEQPKWWIERVIQRKINGPIYGFKEIADKYGNDPRRSSFKSYDDIFPIDYEPETSRARGTSRSMGIIPGSGVFLDEGRIRAPRSRGYCCPSYLLQIQDDSLRKDILETMQVDDATLPDYDRYSFNLGYARTSDAKEKFIQAVSIHERQKNVVIVLNHSDDLSADAFFDSVFTTEYLDFLKKKDFRSITLKAEKTLLVAENAQGKRTLTVIIRPGFTPRDMQNLQLASERMLATGDNSAIESWCAACIMFMYECIWHKAGFKKQQISLAEKIAPSLAPLLRLPTECSLTDLEEVLSHPDLAQDTLRFCKYVSENCSFAPIFEGAIKRTAWNKLNPRLLELERKVMGGKLFSTLKRYLDKRDTVRSLTLHNLPHLKYRIRKSVEEYLETSAIMELIQKTIEQCSENSSSIKLIQKIVKQYLIGLSEDEVILDRIENRRRTSRKRSVKPSSSLSIPPVHSVKPLSCLSRILTKVEDFFSDFAYRCLAYKYGWE